MIPFLILTLCEYDLFSVTLGNSSYGGFLGRPWLSSVEATGAYHNNVYHIRDDKSGDFHKL